jgi:hypothetical protein
MKSSLVFPALHYTAASRHQVKDQDDHRHDQKDVDEAAGKVKAETQKPQNEKNYENCPKHGEPLLAR